MVLKCSVFVVCFLFLACVNCWIHRYHPYPYYPPARKQIYGTVDGFDRLGYQHETRWGFPLFTREADIIFPSEYTTNAPYDFHYFIRGIVHENLLDDDDCLPQLDIMEGGIFDRNVTLRITSLSSCGINSKVSIYGDKAWRN